jgi:hypothetical protein
MGMRHSVKVTSIGNLVQFILIAISFYGCATNSSTAKEFFSIVYNDSMPRADIALIIPGLNQTDSDPGYDSIGIFYKSTGITPVYVNIDWKAVGLAKLSAVAEQIAAMLKDTFTDAHIFLFGFSFGAVIALKLSQLIHTEQVVVCSMSPLFAEDRIHQIFPFRQILGIVTDYSSNGLSYSPNLKTCVYFLYGDHDSFVINNAIIQNRKSSFKCSETTIVENARHDISGRSYLKAIKQIVQKISK